MTLTRILPIAAMVGLAGCNPNFTDKAELEQVRIALAASFCKGASDPSCRFVNSPVKTGGKGVRLPGRGAIFYRTTERLSFTDGRNATWLAPSNTLTDGASIPAVFIPVVGSPTDPAFVNAAAVHDAHCGIGNEEGPEYHSRTWEETHRMFYDALRVGGTAEKRAKVMFAAVYLGGPRWEAPGDRNLSGISDEALQGAMRQTQSFIRRTNPTIPEIERYIIELEEELLREKLREEEDITTRKVDENEGEPPVISDPEPPVEEDPTPTEPPVEETPTEPPVEETPTEPPVDEIPTTTPVVSDPTPPETPVEDTPTDQLPPTLDVSIPTTTPTDAFDCELDPAGCGLR